MDLVQDGNCHSVGEIISRKIGQCASLLHKIISKKKLFTSWFIFFFTKFLGYAWKWRAVLNFVSFLVVAFSLFYILSIIHFAYIHALRARDVIIVFYKEFHVWKKLENLWTCLYGHLKGTVSRDGYFWRSTVNSLISTFCVCADGFQGLSKLFTSVYND